MRFLLVLMLSASAWAGSPAAPGFTKGALGARSLGTLCFGPDGVLFAGDSIGGRIYALDLEDRAPTQLEKPQIIRDLEGEIGAFLGVPASEVLVHDMAVNPISLNTYLTVSRGRGKWQSPWELPNDFANADTLLRLDPAGKLTRVDLDNISHSTFTLPNPIAADAPHVWKKQVKARVDAISDLVYADGKLYVAGLSNEEFASTLRIVPFPFAGEGDVASVEVYHGAHGAYETASPIRAMLPYEVAGEDYVLAAYLCTPLALFPSKDLTEGGKVRGKTIGELGSGNYPTEILAIRSGEKDLVLMSNTNRTLMVFDPADIAAEARGAGITSKVSHREGIGYTDISGTNVQHMDALGPDHVQMIQRAPSGRLMLHAAPVTHFVR